VGDKQTSDAFDDHDCPQSDDERQEQSRRHEPGAKCFAAVALRQHEADHGEKSDRDHEHRAVAERATLGCRYKTRLKSAAGSPGGVVV